MEMNAEDVAQFIQWSRDVMDRAGIEHVVKGHQVDYPILNYHLCIAVCSFGEMSPAAKKFLCIWNGWICHFDFTQDEAPLSDEEASEFLENLIQYNKIWQDILLGKYGSDCTEKNYPVEKTSLIFHPYFYLAKEIYAAMLGVIVPEDADEHVIREHPFYQTTVTWWSWLELKYSKGLGFHAGIFMCYQLYATAATNGTTTYECLVPNCVQFIWNTKMLS